MPKATNSAVASKLERLNVIEEPGMWLLLLEAGVALFLLIFIVWWTMFHGQKPQRPSGRAPVRSDENAPPDLPG
jgi:hypothetical protein